MVNLSNLYSIIGQEIVNDEWQVVETSIKTKHFTIIVKELFLGLNSATTKRFFHILL